ncbi:hypothetical protein AB0J25_20730 [Streptomyces sp. NPDC049910]|uniref:hypothetical protein n=1 Tax=Streptomyces sp. NPDC049910 TaxID=3155278 RepID=UPI00344A390B
MDRKTPVLPAPAGLLAAVTAARGTTPGAPGGGDAGVVGTADRCGAGGGTPSPPGPASAHDTGAWNVPRRTVRTLTHIARGGGRPVPGAAARRGSTGARSHSRSACRPARKRGDHVVHGPGRFPDVPDPDDCVAPFPDEDDVLTTPCASTAARNQLIPESPRKADRSADALPSAGLRDIVGGDVPVLPPRQGKRYVAARADANGAEWTLNASSGLRLRERERGTA